MNEITGKKIFVLYPDERLRNILYGTLRNTFEIYYIYDYEKVRPLAEYYRGSIIILNLIKNDLGWLTEEICSEVSSMDSSSHPLVIELLDAEASSGRLCTVSLHYHGDDAELKEKLLAELTELGGRGRRNFVRYGGNGGNIASIRFRTSAGEIRGEVHDISASGLSFGMAVPAELPVGSKLEAALSLGEHEVKLSATKILERRFEGDIVHIIKFDNSMSKEVASRLLGFIYDSLDSEMNEFIKNLSN